MADLKQILGGVLRDLAHARVLSDLFTKEVSEEYAKDPLLSVFPVPRAEIKEVSIQLKFAVNAVEQQPVDTAHIRREQALRHAPLLSQDIFSEFIRKHPQAVELLKLIQQKRPDLEREVEAAIGNAIVTNPRLVESALKREIAPLARRIQADLEAALLGDPDIRKVFTRTVRITQFRDQLRERVATRVTRLVDGLRSALDAAIQQAVRVDVAVARRDLAEIPEFIVSQVTITANIRNYEWTEVGEEDGKPIRRLQPE